MDAWGGSENAGGRVMGDSMIQPPPLPGGGGRAGGPAGVRRREPGRGPLRMGQIPGAHCQRSIVESRRCALRLACRPRPMHFSRCGANLRGRCSGGSGRGLGKLFERGPPAAHPLGRLRALPQQSGHSTQEQDPALQPMLPSFHDSAALSFHPLLYSRSALEKYLFTLLGPSRARPTHLPAATLRPQLGQATWSRATGGTCSRARSDAQHPSAEHDAWTAAQYHMQRTITMIPQRTRLAKHTGTCRAGAMHSKDCRVAKRLGPYAEQQLGLKEA